MFLKKLFNFMPRSEFSVALDLFNTGQYIKALKKFDELLEKSGLRENFDIPTIELYKCEAHVGLSKSHLEKGDLQSAIEEMKRAVELKPNFADLLYALAGLYVQTGETQKAIEFFKRSLEINPKYFKARVSLAHCLIKAGEIESSLEELESAESICPNFCREKFGELQQALRVRGDDEFTDRLFKEILEEKPSSAQLSRELAIAAIQNYNYTEAIRELKKAIAINPDYPDLHNYLGIAYGNNGMQDDSIAEFEIALKINPNYMKARLNLALALYEKGEFAKAQSHLSRVLEAQPNNQLASNLLNELKAVKGR